MSIQDDPSGAATWVEPGRVVRLRTPGHEGAEYRVGSGYVVSPGWVLTALHVLVSPDQAKDATPEIGQFCEVAVADEPEGWKPGALRWHPSDADVGLVSAPTIGADLPPVRWGRLSGVAPQRWDAAGYPFASMDRRGRHLEHAWGTVSPLTLSDVGEFGLTVRSRSPRCATGERSGWSGLSGAAMMSHGYLVGVIVEDPITYSESITALRAERLTSYPELVGILGEAIVPEDVARPSRQAAHAQVVVSEHDLGEVDRRVRSVVVELLRRQPGFVNLWGESGNGKTFLAQSIAAELSAGGGPAVAIRVAAHRSVRQSVYETDLHSALTLAGCDADHLTRIGMEAKLRELLATPSSSLSAMVLDDATEDDVARLVPQVTVTPVIATSRNKIGLPGRSFMIEAYQPDESLTFLKARLQLASQDQLSHLAEALGHRPLALALAAGVVAGEHLELTELLDSITNDVVATVSATEVLVGARGRTGLAALYRSVRAIFLDDDVSLRIMDLLTWCSSPVRIRDLCVYALETSDPTPVESLSLKAVLKRLNDLALVTSRGPWFEMNELTRRMLRECTPEREGGALARFTETMLAAAPLTDNLDYDGCLGYMGREYLFFRRAVSPFLTQGHLGVLCLTPHEWLVVSEGGPWLDIIDFPEGQVLVEMGPTGVVLRVGGHRRNVSLAQARMLMATVRLHTILADDALSDVTSELSLAFSFHETGRDGLAHRMADLLPADELFRLALPMWSICGRRWVPVPPSAANETCTRCGTLVDDVAWWGRVEEQMGLMADLLAHVKADNDMRCRVEGMAALAAKKAGHDDAHRARLTRVQYACQAAPPTRLSVILAMKCHDLLMAQTVPLQHDYQAPEAVPLDYEAASWLLGAKSVVLGDPALSSRWLKFGERSVIPEEFAATLPELLAHAEAAEIDPAAKPSDRSSIEFDLFRMSFRLRGWESASPHLLYSISLASLDLNDYRFRSALEELWANLSGETLHLPRRCMLCGADADADQIFGNPRALICAMCVRHVAQTTSPEPDVPGPAKPQTTTSLVVSDYDECRFCSRPATEAGPASSRFRGSELVVIICVSCMTLFADASDPPE